MTAENKNKKKVFNDPVYGFITIPYEILLDLIDHRWFQRLRRIHQLGQTHLVYPGAMHSRFHHALGAMHLTMRAIETLKLKGHEITSEEEKATLIAILLHDIGHGPFSHTLEHTIVQGVSHEALSILFMEALNHEFSGELSLAIQIFKDQYHKRFLHQLISGQLDMDRLDYLKRDSFYTGVTEGDVGSNRIIKMLNVKNDELVIDEKAVYSIENFIVSRRFMYWQVYLHKTVVAADVMLIQILRRARKIHETNKLFGTASLLRFLGDNVTLDAFKLNPDLLNQFALLDDSDVLSAIKAWASHPDRILSKLCDDLLNRKIFRIEIKKEQFGANETENLIERVGNQFSLSIDEASWLVQQGELINNAYNPEQDRINLLFKDGSTVDIAVASDNLNISALAKPITKYYRCTPR